MIRIAYVIAIAYLVAWLLMSGKAEEDIMHSEIAEANRVLAESIGEPRMYDPSREDDYDMDEQVVMLELSQNKP